MIAIVFDDFQKSFRCRVCDRRDGRECSPTDHEGGTVIAVFPTVDGSFSTPLTRRGTRALQLFTEEKTRR